MKIHQDIYFKTQRLSHEEFIDAFRRFALETKGWQYLSEQSVEYSFHVNEPACMLQFEDNEFGPAVAICKEKRGVFYIANIVPQASGSIPMSKYNGIARKFADAFSTFSCVEHIPISVKIPNEEIDLKDIVSSPQARTNFEHFLHCHPTSYHPSDIKRLDFFICSAFRFCRKPIDVALLERYLVENFKWSMKDAEWCCTRIQAGLDILKTARNC